MEKKTKPLKAVRYFQPRILTLMRFLFFMLKQLCERSLFRAYQINYFVYFKWMHISANKHATFSLMNAKCSLLFCFSILKIEESKNKNAREIRYITKIPLSLSCYVIIQRHVLIFLSVLSSELSSRFLILPAISSMEFQETAADERETEIECVPPAEK